MILKAVLSPINTNRRGRNNAAVIANNPPNIFWCKWSTSPQSITHNLCTINMKLCSWLELSVNAPAQFLPALKLNLWKRHYESYFFPSPFTPPNRNNKRRTERNAKLLVA